MNLSFIWHMHQPDYRNSSDKMQMPWVFLHAIKDYYDMAWMLERHKELKATFNITPPLINQLKLYYEKPHENDVFLSLWMQDIPNISQTDRIWMIKICKSTPYETMVKRLPSYEKLYNKEHYDNSEFFDLQVLFILAWCGEYLRTNNRVVDSLIKKESNYNQMDKELLLGELSRFISGIFDYYKSLYNDGRISISTTPLNHPILPLLMDMNNATKANSSTNLPKQSISLEDDARLHIQRAIELFEETFGFTPEGFWPAEGGVDEKSLTLLKECGVKWVATDEAILFKSLNSSQRRNLYAPYNFNDVCICFRDRKLSDLIGFTYRYWDASKAAKHFLSNLASINEEDSNNSAFVILDAENAWEFFPNNAFDFFDALYANLEQSHWCKTLHMDDVIKLASKPLNSLAAGSWINGEFNTWVGHREKTRAWELIYLTKRDYNRHVLNLKDEVKAKITEHFLFAECSDWFWWYGDDHFSDFASEFDTLFRSHLIDIYKLMNVSAPSDLFNPISKNRSSQDFWIKPKSHISPPVNGVKDSFFEWLGCGVVDESKLFSTMDKVRGPVSKILYGQDDTYVYFAFESNIQELYECDTITVIIEPIKFSKSIKFSAFIDGYCEEKFMGISIEISSRSIMEMRIDKSFIDLDIVEFRFEFTKEDNVVQTLPGFGELEIDLKTNYNKNWFV
nr:glycoside hydrolase family 57 protein [uncultured Sulfurimonas sp.]